MTKRVIKLFYPSLMLFLVFTFADSILRSIIQQFCIEALLYVILWVFLTIQATFAYIRVDKTRPKDYSKVAMASDFIDIAIVIYVCAAMGVASGRIEGYELTSYIHFSIPFMVLSINQFFWFVVIKSFDIPAVFRIFILFVGMLAVSISELLCHSLWNLVAVVVLIVLLGILRIINKAPDRFHKFATKMWVGVKNIMSI